MRHNFRDAFDLMLDLEGGKTLHHNVGEETHTYAGVYRSAHPEWVGWDYVDHKEEVPEEVLLDFYEVEFWDKVHGDELPEGLDLQVFCTAVNIGVHNASVLLQRVIGAKQDGIIGSKTLQTARLYSVQNLGEQPVRDKLRDYCRESINYYGDVVEVDPDKEMYYNGWLNRAIDTLMYATNRVLPF
jgi:lysozyme family protein